MVPNPHRHRTLVLNNKDQNVAPELFAPDARRSENDLSSETQNPRGSWVTKRDRHMQLINSSIYDKETQIRKKAIEETRQQKALKRDQREKRKILRHLQILPHHSDHTLPALRVHEITIQGLRFHVIDGGSKLARIRGTT